MSLLSRNGFTYRSSSTAHCEELAAIVRSAPVVRPGIGFARKRAVPKSQKYIHRNKVLDLYAATRWPHHLTILTLPGLTWAFERVLLGKRFKLNASTEIWSVESDPAIFRGSLAWIPGKDTGFKVVNPKALSTGLITHYELCEIEDFIAHPDCPTFDAAWLDFTGQFTKRRLTVMRSFWEHKIRHSMVITSLAARWDKETYQQIAGDVKNYLETNLPNSVCVDFSFYADPAPILQVVMEKVTAQKFELFPATMHVI